MHEDEKSDDIAIIILLSPAIAHSHCRPATLSKDLHHYVLWVDKSFEVGKLVEDVVTTVLVYFLLSLIENLHSEYAKYKEDESKEMKVFDNDMHDFHKSHEDSLDVI